MTHLKIDNGLCGTVTELEEGFARVVLQTTAQMAADEQGLIHGGFIFGAADYAAMAAVNEPTVVLAAASCKFSAPSRAGDTIVFEARCLENDGRKTRISVKGFCGETELFSGEFKSVVTAVHVLE